MHTAVDVYQQITPYPLQDASGLQMSSRCHQMSPDTPQMSPSIAVWGLTLVSYVYSPNSVYNVGVLAAR